MSRQVSYNVPNLPFLQSSYNLSNKSCCDSLNYYDSKMQTTFIKLVVFNDANCYNEINCFNFMYVARTIHMYQRTIKRLRIHDQSAVCRKWQIIVVFTSSECFPN